MYPFSDSFDRMNPFSDESFYGMHPFSDGSFDRMYPFSDESLIGCILLVMSH